MVGVIESKQTTLIEDIIDFSNFYESETLSRSLKRLGTCRNSLCFDSAVNDLIPFDSSSADAAVGKEERREIFETDNFQTQN